MTGANYWYSRALAPRAGAATPATASALQDFINGGGSDGGNIADTRGQGRDQRSYDSLSAMMRDPDFRNDWSNIFDMAGVVSMGKSAVRDMLGLGEKVGPPAPSGGLGSPDLVGSGWDGTDAGKEGAAVEAAAIDAVSGGAGPQALAKGGTVKGDRRHGRDDVVILADGGEEVIRAKRAQELGPKFRKEVQKKVLDRGALIAALKGKRAA